MFKKYIALLILPILAMSLNAGEIEPDKKPEPLDKSDFPFPEFEKAKLDNGLTLYVIRDNEQPVVGFRLLVGGGSSVDEIPGEAEFTASLLTRGAGEMSAGDIALALDGIGASFSASASADYASAFAGGLKKDMDKILGIFSKSIIEPVLAEDEFRKLKNQALTGLQYEKSNPAGLASDLTKIAVYGKGHPYAARISENSLDEIEIKNIRDYHKKWFRPNNSSIAIIGDISLNEAVAAMEKYFGKWKKAEVPEIKIPKATPEPVGVHFIEMPGLVQSSLLFTTEAVAGNARDYDLLQLTSNVIGSSPGKLFKILREKYAFTYSPYGYLTSAKYLNRFVFGSDVATEKTDSSITVIKNIIREINQSPMPKDELAIVKNYAAGQWMMSLENTSGLAAAIQNAEFKGIQAETLADYANKILSYSPYDVVQVSRQYLNPDLIHIVVAGDPKIIPGLEKHGAVFRYNTNLEPLSGASARLEKTGISVNNLLDKYAQAIGGRDAISNFTSMKAEGKMALSQRGVNVEGSFSRIHYGRDKMKMELEMQIMKQTVWVNAGKCWIDQGNGNPQPMEPGNSSVYIFLADLFSVADLQDYGYDCKVLGKNGGYILMKAINKKGEESTWYFDENSFLLQKVEKLNDLPGGKEFITEKYEDYKKAGNYLLPGKISSISPTFTTVSEINYFPEPNVDEVEFEPGSTEK